MHLLQIYFLRRCCSACMGFVLLYCAFFLYEDEQNRFQNRLEDLWVSISLSRSEGESLEQAMWRSIARLTKGLLDRVFGEKLLSVRAVVLLAIYSAVSGSIFVTISTSHDPFQKASLWQTLAVVAVFAAACIASIFPRSKLALTPSIVVLATLFVSFVVSEWGLTTDIELFFVSALASVLCNFCCVAFYRLVLNRIANVRRPLTLIFYTGVLAAVCLVLLYPAVWIITTPNAGDSGLEYVVISAMSIIDALFATWLAGWILLMTGQRILWPFLERAVYALYRWKVIRNSKLLGTLGATLLLSSTPTGKANELIQGIKDI